MKYEATSLEEYLDELPADRKDAIVRLRKTINENIPTGFQETMSYNMISYVIPHSIYPLGYHVNPKDPVPFISLTSQKNYIALYHMGIYSCLPILTWFKEEYPKHVKTKLDMGKSCIRFKKVEDIPYDLIAELCRKITVEDFLKGYEAEVLRQSK